MAVPHVFETEQAEVVYPDSDGAPIGETGFHVDATFNLFGCLRHFLEDYPDIYAIAGMFLYYQEGNPSARKTVDIMIVKGVSKHERRSFKIWEEGAVPCMIVEITSKETQYEDMIRKGHVYATLGVREYFLFDPLRDYLESGFIGLRLKDGEYMNMTPKGAGALFSQELGVFLQVEDKRVRIIDPRTQKPIPDLEEAIALAEQEAQRAERAEAEIARLRALLEQKDTIL